MSRRRYPAAGSVGGEPADRQRDRLEDLLVPAEIRLGAPRGQVGPIRKAHRSPGVEYMSCHTATTIAAIVGGGISGGPTNALR